MTIVVQIKGYGWSRRKEIFSTYWDKVASRIQRDKSTNQVCCQANCIITWNKEVDGINKNCALETVHVLECWSSDGCGARDEGDEEDAGIC